MEISCREMRNLNDFHCPTFVNIYKPCFLPTRTHLRLLPDRRNPKKILGVSSFSWRILGGNSEFPRQIFSISPSREQAAWADFSPRTRGVWEDLENLLRRSSGNTLFYSSNLGAALSVFFQYRYRWYIFKIVGIPFSVFWALPR